MLTPVVTDPRKASRALAIAVEEMDKRYDLFAENNVKDLESYNELMRADHRWADCKPQIVIIIDELADLMMAAPSEVENSICRLAQKARAAGMHLIVATQRPSVDVVTGLIKANIPSRIAFSVASQFDSRTILDMAGAEKLLGKGDMLFSPVGSTKPYRVQGPYISEKEIDKVIKFVKKEGGDPSYDDEIQKALDSDGRKGGSEPQDELTEDAIAFIFKSKQASVSMLQRRFRIGYNRAARIIDEIEEKGIIGPSDGSRPRQLLMTEEEYYGGYDDAADETPEELAADAPDVTQTEPDPVIEPEPAAIEDAADTVREHEMDPEDDGLSHSRLSNTQAMDSFNSLPESVRRMVMDADSDDNY
jgi:S-DNA-T family DNA segregation ATPase FtsK/SpoIIIE